MFAAPYSHTRHFDELKWLLVAALAALVLAIASQTAGAAEPAEQPKPPATIYVVSPWNGFFLAGEDFGAPPFVEVGSHVEPSMIVGLVDDVVAIPPGRLIVTAGIKGTVVRILVTDGQMVVVGQPLMEVLPDPPVPPPEPK